MEVKIKTAVGEEAEVEVGTKITTRIEEVELSRTRVNKTIITPTRDEATGGEVGAEEGVKMRAINRTQGSIRTNSNHINRNSNRVSVVREIVHTSVMIIFCMSSSFSLNRA